MDFKVKQIESKIIMLKQKLRTTDYKAIKYAEGLLTEEEYEPVKAARQAWRDEINKLEAELKAGENFKGGY